MAVVITVTGLMAFASKGANVSLWFPGGTESCGQRSAPSLSVHTGLNDEFSEALSGVVCWGWDRNLKILWQQISNYGNKGKLFWGKQFKVEKQNPKQTVMPSGWMSAFSTFAPRRAFGLRLLFCCSRWGVLMSCDLVSRATVIGFGKAASASQGCPTLSVSVWVTRCSPSISHLAVWDATVLKWGLAWNFALSVCHRKTPLFGASLLTSPNTPVTTEHVALRYINYSFILI